MLKDLTCHSYWH